MKNKVELIGHYGSDEIIALSAWTSTSRELSDDKRERIPKMLETLWFNGHETPFEKGVVHFLVDTDIATHIHLLKHRISSFNGESARYKELKEDKFYIPSDFDVELTDNALDSLSCFTLGERLTWADKLKSYTEKGNELYHECLSDLTPVLGRKRAKESARFFKTYNSQIQGDVSFNMRSFSNFLNLRNSPHAQLEIRELAAEMVELVSGIEGSPFKHTLDVWERKGK
jgi:thymidylate synthase (FAD)